jgi:DNA-binding NarL/FixJ family response regulator
MVTPARRTASIIDRNSCVSGRSSEPILWRASSSHRALTAREVEILRLVGRGLTNSQIAEQLEIESGTVRIHLHRIYKKFGTNNRVLLANYAQDLGYTGPD